MVVKVDSENARILPKRANCYQDGLGEGNVGIMIQKIVRAGRRLSNKNVARLGRRLLRRTSSPQNHVAERRSGASLRSQKQIAFLHKIRHRIIRLSLTF